MRTQIRTIPLKTYLCGALLLGAGLFPATAMAQDPSSASPATSTKADDPTLSQMDDEVDPSGESATIAADGTVVDQDEKGWSVTASVSTRIYQGMFVGLGNTDEDLSSPHASPTSNSFSRWSNIYSISALYRLDDFSFGAQALASHWMSRAGGLNGPFEFRFQDLVLGAGWDGYNIDPIDARVAVSYNITLPTSTVSQTANLVVGNYLGLSLSKTFMGKLSLAYSASGGWTPHTTPYATIDRDVAQIYREDDIIGNQIASIGGYSTEFSLSHSFIASVPVWDKLRASASYTYGSYWSHDPGTKDDEFTADVDGLQKGRNYGDITVATANLSYPVGDYITLTGGISTTQQPKTSDNKGFRFPWWNLTGAAANRSSINLNVRGKY